MGVALRGELIKAGAEVELVKGFTNRSSGHDTTDVLLFVRDRLVDGTVGLAADRSIRWAVASFRTRFPGAVTKVEDDGAGAEDVA